MLAESFPMLIRRLTLRHHADRGLQGMAERTGIPYQTLWRWDRGASRMPDYPLLQRLAEAYGYEARALLELAGRDQLRYLRGEPVPVPNLEPRRRGPNPKGRRIGKSLAALAVAWLSIGSVPAQPGTIHEPQLLDNMPVIGSRRRRLWPVLCTA